MRNEQQRRVHNRRNGRRADADRNRRRRDGGILKRCLAVIAVAATLLTGMNYPGMENVFAEEKSGYRIDVAYSEDKTQAVLTGNTDDLAAGVTLTGLKDAEGTEYTPDEFNEVVTENGTYIYTLTYSSGGGTTAGSSEKQETLKVNVDGIGAAEASDTASSSGKSTEVQGSVSVDAAPAQMSVAELEALAATYAETGQAVKYLPIYAQETNVSMGIAAGYTGGLFEEEFGHLSSFENLVACDANGEVDDPPKAIDQTTREALAGRRYHSAAYYLPGDNEARTIIGLYPLVVDGQTAWYYTTAATPGDSGDPNNPANSIPAGVALKVPDGATIRINFTVEGDSRNVALRHVRYTEETQEEKVEETRYVNIWASQVLPSATELTEGAMAVVQFTLPAAYKNAEVIVTDKNTNKPIAEFNTLDPAGTGLTEGEIGTYSGSFLVPDGTGVSDAGIEILFRGIASSTNLWERVGFINTKDRAFDNNWDGMRVHVEIDYNDGQDDTWPSTDPYGGTGEYKGMDIMWSMIKDRSGGVGARTILWQRRQSTFIDTIADAKSQDLYYQDTDGSIRSSSGFTTSFVPGEHNQQIKLEFAYEGRDSSNVEHYNFQPVSLSVYQFTEGSLDDNNNGAALTSDTTFMDTVPLPRVVGESIEVALQTGGTMTITYKEVKNTTFSGLRNDYLSQSWLDANRLNKPYTTSGKITLGGSEPSPNLWPDKSDNSLYYSMDRPDGGSSDPSIKNRVYEIKVNGARYPYTMALFSESSIQKGVTIGNLEGVESGVSNNGTVNTEYSYYQELTTRTSNGQNITASRKNMPLTTGSRIWMEFMPYEYNNTSTHNNQFPFTLQGTTSADRAFMINVMPKMGYSAPFISWTNQQGRKNQIEKSGTNVVTQKTSGGKIYYRFAVATNNSANDIQSEASVLHFTAYPLRFSLKYSILQDGSNSNGAVGTEKFTEPSAVKPADTKYYVLKLPDNMLEANQYLKGYEVRIYRTGGGNGTDNNYITLTDGSTPEGYYLPGELLDMEKVYTTLINDSSFVMPQAVANGENAANLGFTIRLVGIYSTSPTDGYLQDTYTVRMQKSFNGSTNTGSGADRYPSGNFDSSERTFTAYTNTIVGLGGYEDVYTTSDGKTYLVGAGSTLETTAGGSNPKLDLVYVNAATVQLSNLGTNPSGSNGYTLTSNNDGTYTLDQLFTGSYNDRNTINLANINPGTAPEEGQELSGWKITNTGADETLYLPAGTIDLHTLGVNNAALWNRIFQTDGEVLLEAQWSSMLPITAAGTNGYTTFKNPTVEQYYGNQDITLTMSFKYDHDTKADIERIWNDGASDGVRTTQADAEMKQYFDFAVYGVRLATDNNGTVTGTPPTVEQVYDWSLRGAGRSNSDGVTTTTQLSLGDDVDEQGYAIATISVTIPAALVTYDDVKNQIFYAFAWNNRNELDQGNDTDYEAVTNQTETSPYQSFVTAATNSGVFRPHASVTLAMPHTYWYYGQMVARPVQSVNSDYSLITGSQIQWKNSDTGSKTFEAEFKYDTAVPWDQQTGTNANDNGANNNLIRIVVAERVGDSGAWTLKQRYNPDNSFGSDIDTNYTIQLIEPESGSDTFTVQVRVDNMATNADNFGKNFIVTAFNSQNGDGTSPNPSARIAMSGIRNDLTAASQSTVGTTVPAVQRVGIIYPTGVQVYNGTSNVLQTEQTVEKYNNQASNVYTAQFTYDSSTTDNDAAMTNMYNPSTGNNYFIGFYRNTNGSTWELVDGYDGNTATKIESPQGYITEVSGPANGRITVSYRIPAADNDSNAQYRLVAFYGNINGNNEITNTTLQDAMSNVTSLANVVIRLSNTVYNQIESYWNNGDTWGTGSWNQQMREAGHGPQGEGLTPYGNNDIFTGDQDDSTSDVQDPLVLTAQFEYDVDTKSAIEGYWNNRETIPTTDDGMGYYMNWALYGYNSTTQRSSTWLIREQVVEDKGMPISSGDISVNLELGDESSAGTADDGLGLATITITILPDSITYENLNGQALYLFVWNDGSNSAAGTEFKALAHDDSSGDATPYNEILNGIDNSNYSSDRSGTLAGAYWNLAVVPRAIQPVENATYDESESVTLAHGQVEQTITRTFKYDNTIPWSVQSGSGANTRGSKYIARAAVYRQDYNGGIESTTWIRAAAANGDNTFGGFAANHDATISVDEGAGTITVQVTVGNNALNASYANFGANYKIVAFNHQNYTGTLGSLLNATAGSNSGTLISEIGTDIPSYTATVNFTPLPMLTTQSGTIGHHEREIGKAEGVEGEAQFTFWPNNSGVSWTSGDNVNTAMQAQFDWQYENGNVIFTLWKRTATDENNAYTGNFSFVDVYNGGAFDQVATDGGADYIKEITKESDGSLLVKVHLGADSDTGQYRVYAWYASGNADGAYGIADIQDTVFAAPTPDTEGSIPYATGTVTANAADTYITIPREIRLFDGQGSFDTVSEGGTPVTGANGSKVYTAGTSDNVSDQYAGNYGWVTYDTAADDYENAPEIEVTIEDNKILQLNNMDSDLRVGVYFADGYKNVTQSSSESGMVLIGYLSRTRTQTADSNLGQGTQTVPIGTELIYWLNTTKSTNQNEKYTTKVRYHFRNVS